MVPQLEVLVDGYTGWHLIAQDDMPWPVETRVLRPEAGAVIQLQQAAPPGLARQNGGVPRDHYLASTVRLISGYAASRRRALSMEPILDYRGSSREPESPSARPPRSSLCGGLSVVLFIVTIYFFVMANTSPEKKSVIMVEAMFATALVGLCLGIAGLVRNERTRVLAITGIVLNGACVACGVLFLAIGQAMFGGPRHGP